MGFEPPHPNHLPTGERERTEIAAISVLHPLVPAKAGTQIANCERAALDSRLRGNERRRCVDSTGICSNISRTPALTSNSVAASMPLPLSGLLVVSLEQAVAAPMCTCRLADAGARVIKVERPEGDFARYYDKLAVPRTPKRPSPLPSPRERGEGAHRASGEEEKGRARISCGSTAARN